MGILSQLMERRANSGSVGHPRDPVIAEWLGGGVNTASGIAVTPDTAMRETAVYTCIKILSESVAQLPLHVYRNRKDGGRDKAYDHPLYEVIHSRPNKRHTSFDFRRLLMSSLGLRGNFVARIEPTGGKAVGELKWLEPDRVDIALASDGSRLFKYYPANGSAETYLQSEIFYVSDMSLDGIRGLSPITYHRETVGASLAIKEFGARLFSNGTHLGTVFEHPTKLSEQAHKNLQNSLEKKWSGVTKAGKAMVVEEGMKVAKLGMTAEDAQYLESRKFSRTEIAGIYRVPPHMIGEMDKATFSNIEQQSIDFVTGTLMPCLLNIEHAMQRDLLSGTDYRKGYRIKFNVNAMLRGDAAARANYYRSRFNTGSITPNQIREHEGENPQEGGDKAFVPLNMIPIDQAGRSNGGNDNE